jgi:hypothetical protein
VPFLRGGKPNPESSQGVYAYPSTLTGDSGYSREKGTTPLGTCSVNVLGSPWPPMILNMALLHVGSTIEPIHNKALALPKLIKGLMFCAWVIVGEVSKHIKYLTVCDFIASRHKSHGLPSC